MQPDITILQGDCVDSMRTLPAGSVHTVVTSPPYFGLRDYGVAGQIGLEDSPAAYVAKMVEVFREVRRVLRADGTLWLNLGDSYGPGKQLAGIPWRVAFALQDDGWFLRQDIIWHKPNPMPESVRDRCTKAHEYLFLLSKSPRYYFDAEAIKEPARNWGTRDRTRWKGNASHNGRPGHTGCTDANHEATGKNRRSVWSIDGPSNRERECLAVIESDLTPAEKWAAVKSLLDDGQQSDVWRVTPKPYKDAHFATFPPALVEPCVLAGTSAAGVCGRCGSPLVRQVERERVATRPGTNTKVTGDPMTDGNRDPERHVTRTVTTGWRRQCDCEAASPVPATVLDPFGGSGTTAEVAWKLGRSSILCELNPDYVALAHKRLAALEPVAGAA